MGRAITKKEKEREILLTGTSSPTPVKDHRDLLFNGSSSSPTSLNNRELQKKNYIKLK